MRLLVSGASWIEIASIKLYKEKRVGEIASARSAAMKKLGPAGSALGVVGTPSWTLAGEAVALSLVSGFLASAAAKEGMKELRKVQEDSLDLVTRSGEWFAPTDVKHVMLPQPAVWQAVRGDEAYCLTGDDFISFKIETQQQIDIRWSAVSCMID